MSKDVKGELRRLEFDVSLRESGDGNSIVGYAAVFDSVANGEVIRRGAFKRTLNSERDIIAYWSHNNRGSQVLGRRANGTLVLREDDKGLWFELRPNLETTIGKDALALVKRGDVSGASFGFRAINVTTAVIESETVHELREVRLLEISLVSEPWYEATTVAVRDSDGADGDCSDSRGSHSTIPLSVRERELNLMEMEA